MWGKYMFRIVLAGLCTLPLVACSSERPVAEPARPDGRPTFSATDMLDKTPAATCWSDAECDVDQNCECPLSSPNGNCEQAGICVPRDGRSAREKAALPEATSAANLVNCRSMRNLSFIPPGYHPTTAQWALDSQGQINDLVCIAKTEGRQIRVLRWLDYPLPAGYYTLRIESGVDTTFRGCRQWTEWQGTRRCTSSFDLYVMQRNN